MAKSHAVLRALRLVHLYVGVFIAPALLFFSFSGALQIFSFHETTPGSSYKPPAWAVTMAQIHKKQTPVIPSRRPSAAGRDHGDGGVRGNGSGSHSDSRNPESNVAELRLAAHNPVPLKIFFLLVAIGLFTSTVSGIYMSFKYTRNQVTIALLLLAGTVIPVTMVFI